MDDLEVVVAILREHVAGIDRRLDEGAELRRRIENGEYVTRTTYNQRHEEVTRRLDQLERWQANVTGRAIGLGLVGGVLVAVTAAVLTHVIGG